LTARGGLSFQLWLRSALGVGAEVAGVTQTNLGGDATRAFWLGPALALRRPFGETHGVLLLGGGYARVRRTEGGIFCSRGCDPPVVSEFDGFGAGVGAGWLVRPFASKVELGSIVCLDILVDPTREQRADISLTINLEIGLGFGG
jgi:hypothetical protein